MLLLQNFSVLVTSVARHLRDVFLLGRSVPTQNSVQPLWGLSLNNKLISSKLKDRLRAGLKHKVSIRWAAFHVSPVVTQRC